MTKVNNFKFNFTSLDKQAEFSNSVVVDNNGKRNKYAEVLPIVKNNGSDITLITQFSLKIIKDMVENGSLIINTPENEVDSLQRGVVQKSSWISNIVADILIGIQPIPSITICQEENDKYSSIDGQQRLFAIYSILTNKIAFNQTNTCLDGKFFRDLPREVQEVLENRTILAQVVRKEISFLRPNFFIKLNTTGVKLNSIELTNALHNSEFSLMMKTLPKQNKYVASLVTTAKADLVTNNKEFEKCSNSYLGDRMTEYGRLLFAYANANISIDKTSTSGRAMTRLSRYMLEKAEKENTNVEKIKKNIINVSKLAYTLFGPKATHELYKHEENDVIVYDRDNDTNLILHKSSISRMQLNSVFFIADYLYKNGIRTSKITPDIKNKVAVMLDEAFSAPKYIIMKGYNNNNTVYNYNLALAKKIFDLFGEEVK